MKTLAHIYTCIFIYFLIKSVCMRIFYFSETILIPIWAHM
ncbi:antigen presenting cell lectin-like receptor A1, isoform CRA_a [Rattus norvegicus]|uniref:Antigen presenting cell lectin-like receptor A1, isoform CRA_a n=1 Tax=Rattus norvegicus TaxID=10116 RepID=A6ILG8_RAT|nr:antigen presenting cell lectin-like receptor A1, isoform CRA_a [Rattus norvegicus]